MKSPKDTKDILGQNIFKQFLVYNEAIENAEGAVKPYVEVVDRKNSVIYYVADSIFDEEGEEMAAENE